MPRVCCCLASSVVLSTFCLPLLPPVTSTILLSIPVGWTLLFTPCSFSSFASSLACFFGLLRFFCFWLPPFLFRAFFLILPCFLACGVLPHISTQRPCRTVSLVFCITCWPRNISLPPFFPRTFPCWCAFRSFLLISTALSFPLHTGARSFTVQASSLPLDSRPNPSFGLGSLLHYGSLRVYLPNGAVPSSLSPSGARLKVSLPCTAALSRPSANRGIFSPPP